MFPDVARGHRLPMTRQFLDKTQQKVDSVTNTQTWREQLNILLLNFLQMPWSKSFWPQSSWKFNWAAALQHWAGWGGQNTLKLSKERTLMALIWLIPIRYSTPQIRAIRIKSGRLIKYTARITQTRKTEALNVKQHEFPLCFQGIAEAWCSGCVPCHCSIHSSMSGRDF